jgi:MarR family transcriptional regulator, 2-MHQ and catechol-resistance regulon repressor
MRPKRPNLSSDRSGIHLWLLLWKATKAIETQAHRSVRTTGLGLSDFGVLEALLHKGPLPVNALGKKVLLTSGSMTAAVDRLERRGWVERRFAESDRRSRIVSLTAQGAKLIRQVFADHARDMELAFSSLDKPEKEDLANLLRKLGHMAEVRTATKRSRSQNQQASKEGS